MKLDLIYIYDNETETIPSYFFDSINSLSNKQDINLHIINNNPEKIQKIEGFNSVFVENIIDYKTINLDFGLNFRDKFFENCISRFFVLENYIREKDLRNVFHCEGDIYFQVSLEEIYKEVNDKNKLWSCRDSPSRLVCSIMFIPNYTKIKEFNDFSMSKLSTFGFLNDMELLGMYDEIYSFNTSYNPNCRYIFDAAALGQCLFGIDPRNSDKVNTIGFINETSVYKPDFRNFNYRNGLWFYKDKKIALLHIHSKDFTLIHQPLKIKHLYDLNRFSE
jgi:hypothetical protein